MLRTRNPKNMSARSTTLPPLILASESPRRSELLRALGVNFSVIPSEAKELRNEYLSPAEIAQLNAYRKARTVAKRHPDALVLAADTMVCVGKTLLGKPANLEEAYRMLKQLQGRAHHVVTGVCLIHLRGHRQKLFADTTQVQFRQLTASDIRDYMARINPLDKAGAYAIQEHGDRVVEMISGSYSNVVGLPLERLKTELASWQSLPPRA